MKNLIGFFNKLFRSRNFILIISLLASIVLWFYVTGVYNPQSTLSFKPLPFNVDIKGSVPESNDLIVVDDKPIEVSIVLEGPRPALAMLQKEKIKIKLDYNSITAAGQYTLPIIVELPTSELKVISTTPKEVTLEFFKKTVNSIDVKVNVTGKVKEGFIADTAKAYPTSLNLTGPLEKIKKIKTISTNIDVSDASETILRKTDYIFLDENGTEIDKKGIVADFAQVTVTAPVLKSKSVPLSVNIINSSGGANSKFANIQISPVNVIIAATPELIDSINSLELGTIDLAQVGKEGISKEFDIAPPNGTKTFDSPAKAVVNITYPEIVSKTFDVKAFSFINLPAGRKASQVTSTVRVTVIGVQADMNSLNADQIKAVVDMADASATGKIQYNLTFELPQELKVGVLGKYTALINVK
jgi:YbbR domain-containing protein